MQLKRVVVTGIGALTPLGNNLTEYWDGLINGVSGAGMITQFDASKFRTKFACEVKGFDPTAFLDRKGYIRSDILHPINYYQHFYIANIGPSYLFPYKSTKIKIPLTYDRTTDILGNRIYPYILN